MMHVRLCGLVALTLLVACSGGGGSTDPGNNGGSGGGGGGGGGSIQCPSGAICMVNDAYLPTTITVTSGADVPFTNGSGLLHTVTFDNPRSPGVTDIPLHSSGTNTRTFSAAGRFPFHCTQHGGMTGEIVVN